MPEQKWAKRKLNITACNEVYRGNNDKGEFVIYEIAATNDQGLLVSQKLSSFGALPLGWGDYEVAPYYKDGQLKNYTVRKPGGSSGSRQAIEALTARVQTLEEQVSRLMDEVKGLVALTRQMSMDKPEMEFTKREVPVGAPAEDDEDIPF